jgi:hypothetical protein
MRRPILLALLALLVLPAAAMAAQVKISPTASPVSSAGVTTVEAANPNSYALRGKATVTAGGRRIASRAVRLPKRSVTELTLRLDGKALSTLRAAGGRATITLALRRPGGRKATARRTLTLKLRTVSGDSSSSSSNGSPTVQAPAAQGNRGAANGAAPGQQEPQPQPQQPAPPASNKWTGRMGTEGAYDDLELTVENGQMTITKVTTVPVMCFENGGSYSSALSFELFDATGPWTIGTDGLVEKKGIAVNQLVSGGERTMNYKVTNTAQTADRVTGTLGMSFFHSKYNVFTNTITFINCSGSQSFEAIPAP